jgi:hypothetical protein
VSSQELTVYVHPQETVTCTWVDAARQPDASVSTSKSGPFKADGVYRSVAHKSQTVKRSTVRIGETYDFWARLQNDSLAPDLFLVGAQATGPSTIGIQILRTDEDVTADIMAGTYEPTFMEGGLITLRIRLTIGPGTPRGVPYKLDLTATSKTDATKVDVVRAVVVR